MWKAIAIKELRDVLWIVIAACLAALIWMAGTIGLHVPFLASSQQILIPFLSSDLLGPFSIIVGAAAIGLGVRQSTCALCERSSQFLLHRPVDRWDLVRFKILIGLAITSGLAVAVIGALTLWASLPFSNAAPFELWMTIPGWIVVWSVPIVYHAAFLSGIRPARWYGTRLIPVVGAIPLAFLIALLSHWSLITGLVLSVGLNSLVWIAIRNVVENRDYA